MLYYNLCQGRFERREEGVSHLVLVCTYIHMYICVPLTLRFFSFFAIFFIFFFFIFFKNFYKNKKNHKVCRVIYKYCIYINIYIQYVYISRKIYFNLSSAKLTLASAASRGTRSKYPSPGTLGVLKYTVLIAHHNKISEKTKNIFSKYVDISILICYHDNVGNG